MTPATPSTLTRRRIDLLDWDPDLGHGLSDSERHRAEQALPAPAATLPRGEWLPEHKPPAAGHLGYLVGEGLMIRRVQVAEGFSAELIGSGDLLRPWQEDASSFCHASWEVLEPTTLILLEPPVARQVSHWPEITANIVARGLRRSRYLAANAAVSHMVGVEARLLILLWQLAETCGRVTADAVTLQLRLPHRILADLAGTRRPTVTTALSALQDDGRIEISPDGYWKLLGDSPC